MNLGRRSLLASLLALGACQRSERGYSVIIIEPEPGAPRPKLWGPGYTDAELEAAQARFGLRFPPDLLELYREKRLLVGPDWVRDDEKIRKALDWPYEGILFDVENNDLWWPEWGARPSAPEARARVLREIVEAAPKLIPIVGHRYLPETPNEAGNPVFSVWQADIIYYGAHLADYLTREFAEQPPSPVAQPVRTIPFWSEMVVRAGHSTRAEALASGH